jgi:hypothetical protein
MKTELIVITDRSGSMQSIRKDCIGGFESFIADQKKVEGECRVTALHFDNVVDYHYVARPLAEISTLQLEPRGMTALYDAVGRALNEQGKRIADEKWAELVIVMVITDGAENASQEYSHATVKSMIAHAESKGWKFIFLATGLDAVQSMRVIASAVTISKSFSKNSVGTQSAYASASMDTVQLRSGKAAPNEPTL